MRPGSPNEASTSTRTATQPTPTIEALSAVASMGVLGGGEAASTMPVARLLASLLTSGDRLRQPGGRGRDGLSRHYRPRMRADASEASSTYVHLAGELRDPL